MGSAAGGAVSAGCVRLANAQMQRLRALLRIGTPVVISR
jgi:lipoprotein-anchoring transpeptidase ErfK/SrfK